MSLCETKCTVLDGSHFWWDNIHWMAATLRQTTFTGQLYHFTRDNIYWAAATLHDNIDRWLPLNRTFTGRLGCHFIWHLLDGCHFTRDKIYWTAPILCETTDIGQLPLYRRHLQEVTTLHLDIYWTAATLRESEIPVSGFSIFTWDNCHWTAPTLT